MNTIINALYEYFKKCPLMADGKLNVDFLPEKGREYSIDAIPAEEVIERYIRGRAKCQYVFTIRTVTPYGREVLQQLDNSGFFEQLSEWLREQTNNKNLPAMPEGNEPKSIEAQSTGYLFSATVDTAQYQIQCRLVYKRKGDR